MDALQSVLAGRAIQVWRTLTRWRRPLLGGASATLLVAIWLHATAPGSYVGFDFASYVEGARAVSSGQNPYHHLAQLSPDTRTGHSGVQASGYVYPPLVAVLLSVPVRLGFDIHILATLWSLVTLAAVIWMARELNIGLRGRGDWWSTLAFAAICLIPSLAMYDLFLGQADLLLASLAVVSCGLWLRRNPWAPFVLATGIAIKWNVALILLIWLWKGDWRSTLRALVAVAILVIVPFALVGLDGARDYLQFMLHWNGFGANADVVNQAPHG